MSTSQWAWPSGTEGRPIEGVPEEMEMRIHPYFVGRVPMDVARRIQASLNAADVKFQAEVDAAARKNHELEVELERQKLVGRGWHAIIDQRDATIRSLRAQLAKAKRKPKPVASEPKRCVNAPGWARILAD